MRTKSAHPEPASIPAATPAQVLEQLVQEAEAANASDIHLQMRGSSAEVLFRLDGVMNAIDTLPEHVAERVFGRIKFLANLKTYQESLPQDGRIDKIAINSRTDIRVATYPTVTGEKIVLRLFSTFEARPLPDLQFPAEITAELQRVLAHTSGLLLLTGPAGSGKTTTIYACLRELSTSGGRHIITVEDPVEQVITGIMQTEVNEARGLDFAKASRHLLRQDPQVLVVGEIRDEETATIAVRAALTGHLVISTLHAGSCKGVLDRLLALTTDPSAVAASLELILNQRLLRHLCVDCRGQGCNNCLNTGYRGRFAAIESLRITDALRRQIGRGELEGIRANPSLADQAARLVQSGVTDHREVQRVLG
jgi:type II secretory ATPase GspE/PulE/Tfp pilus assembly ATPase PilB-like protein